jgi:Zn-dependent protease
MRNLTGVVAALALAACVPSLAAAAALVDAGAAAQISDGVGAWGWVVSNSFTAIQADPALGASDSSAILGRVRLELALNPRSEPALAFIPYLHLPSRSGFEAAAFSALTREQRARALTTAVSAAAADLQPRAEALAARAAQGDLSTAERAQLDAAAASWFYLTPETAAAVKKAAAEAHGDAALGLARRIAASIPFRKTPDEKAVRAELKQVFAGAALIAAEDKARPGSDLVAARLAPYVARALDESEARARERGVPEGQVYSTLIKKHTLIFGRVADRTLFKTLRSRGEWTEFAAAASLHAADRLRGMGDAARRGLSLAAEGDSLRLAIPAWHPLHGRYPSVAHWLVDVAGPAVQDAAPRVFGIPLIIKRSFYPAFAMWAYTFAKILPAGHPHAASTGIAVSAALGLVAAILFNVSVLAHEFGHILAARAFGIRTRNIMLNFLGGGANVVRYTRRTRPELLIALAGPAVSVLAALAFLMPAFILALLPLVFHFILPAKMALAVAIKGSAAAGIITGLSTTMAALNIFWVGFNLLPVLPADGGRIIRAALARFFGHYRATKIAGALGVALSAGFLWVPFMSFPARVLTALFFAFFSALMSVHPGTVTIDEKPSSKS